MSLFTLRSGATLHPETSVLQFFTDIIAVAGVLNLSATNHFKVTEKASPDMTVKVTLGRAYIKSSTSNGYPVRMDADGSGTITSNGSGNPRKDAVVLYIDLAASPTTNADNVAKLAVVAGTPGASPQAPLDADIQTAVGASNPFIRLANVTVVSGASQINNADISDQRAAVQFISTPSYKVGSTTYDISTTGSLAVTGIGFKPRLLEITVVIDGATTSSFSDGFTDGVTTRCKHQNELGKMRVTNDLAVFWTTDPSVDAILSLASFDNDGFTLTKTKNGSPTGTATILYKAYS